MKKKNTKMSELGKKANRDLVLGTVLKILLPGTGIGSIISAKAWAEAMVDVYHHPELYPEFDNNTFRREAQVPLKVDSKLQEKVDAEMKEFVDEIKKKLDDFKNEDESQ